MEHILTEETKLSNEKRTNRLKKFFRGSTRLFQVRNIINRSTLNKLRFYVARRIHDIAIEMGEDYVERGIPLLSIIKDFFEDGVMITERQMQNYARALSLKETGIRIFRGRGRGRRWSVTLTENTTKWRLKIRNDRCAREERISDERRRENLRQKQYAVKQDISYTSGQMMVFRYKNIVSTLEYEFQKKNFFHEFLKWNNKTKKLNNKEIEHIRLFTNMDILKSRQRSQETTPQIDYN